MARGRFVLGALLLAVGALVIAVLALRSAEHANDRARHASDRAAQVAQQAKSLNRQAATLKAQLIRMRSGSAFSASLCHAARAATVPPPSNRNYATAVGIDIINGIKASCDYAKVP